jgi:hypothetical protein
MKILILDDEIVSRTKLTLIVEQNLKIKKEREAKILMATSYRDKDRIIESVQYRRKRFD